MALQSATGKAWSTLQARVFQSKSYSKQYWYPMYRIAVMMFAFVLCSCAQTVEVRHRLGPAAEGIDRLNPAHVRIQMVPEALQRDPVQGGFLAVGLLNEWELDLYSTLPDALREILSRQFETIEIIEGYSFDCADCALFVRPKIVEVALNKVTMQTLISLELPFYDARGQLVAKVSGRGESSVMSASRLGAGIAGYFIPFLGNMVGEHVVKGTVQAALNNALEDMAGQLRREAVEGKLARTWLPASQMDRDKYGKQEYAAERVAQAQGCNLLQDGLLMIEQEYFREVYQTYCWARPSLRIVCEYGRCVADTADEAHVSANPWPE